MAAISSHWKSTICALVFGLLGACSQGSEQPPADNETAQTDENARPDVVESDNAARPIVVFLGDSLTAGYDLPAQDALPEQLASLIDGLGIEATILNAGVSGDTTRAALERYDWSVRGVDADILVLALGGNDYLSGYQPDIAEANLAQIIETAQADGVQVAMVGIEVPAGMAPAGREADFARVFPALAQRYEVALYADFLGPVLARDDLTLPDGIHPNAEGVSVIAEALVPFVAEQIEQWRLGDASEQ